MLLIVAHHYVVNSGLTAADGPIYADPLSFRSLFLLLFGAWGKTGINCFVLITGYFMCKSEISVRKLIKLLAQIYFYRIAINAIFWLTGYADLSVKSLVKLLLPVTDISDGFTGCFLVFYLCIPFLNILIQNLKERQHICLIVLCLFIYTFLGTFPYLNVTMNYVSWFIVLFFVASYIRLYPKQLFGKTKLWAWATVLFALISMLSVVCCAWLGEKLDLQIAFYFVTDSNTFLALATALSAFLLFKNLKIRHSRFINAVASTTFGVLLIHANSDTMREWLWKDTLNNVGAYASDWFVLHAIGSVAAVFAVCSMIDYLRIRFIEKPFLQKWNQCSDGMVQKYKSIERTIMQKFNVEK